MVLTGSWWEPQAPERQAESEVPARESGEQDAEEMVSETEAAIRKDGFCLWTCSRLGGAAICVVDNTDLPEADFFDDPAAGKREAMASCPVYTLRELECLAEANEWTDRMVLEAKRCAPGAVVTRVVKKKRGMH